MQSIPALTSDFCLHVIIDASPLPSRYDPNKKLSEQMLYDLGVKGDLAVALYIAGIKSRISPWLIDEGCLPVDQDTDLKTASQAIMTNAFIAEAAVVLAASAPDTKKDAKAPKKKGANAK
jgi:hypothetical protein